MSTPEIAKVLLRSGVDFAPDAHLWCWATDNYLQDALGLIDRLGFRYVRTMVWVKVRGIKSTFKIPPGHQQQVINAATMGTFSFEIAPDYLPESLQIGLGQYLRGSHELCLFATRGKTQLPDVAPPSVIFAPRGEHSAKPDESFEVFEKVSPGPRVEMFSRRRREGWASWGLEVDERLESKSNTAQPEQLVLGGQ
jgi:N6-adenosine-specific RNA methylase IME4